MGSIEELKKLWKEEELSRNDYYIDNIKKGNQEFWVIINDETKEIIGELHIVWNLTDKDKADGNNRAYLCDFRILEKYRRQEFGSLLMERVLQRVKDKGYLEGTIEVDTDLDILIHIYKDMGFDIEIKTNIKSGREFVLLLNNLEN